MRLIDADKIVNIYKSCADMFSNEELDGVETVIEWIDNAPTVCDIDQIREEIANEKGVFPKEHYIRIIDKYTKGEDE